MISKDFKDFSSWWGGVVALIILTGIVFGAYHFFSKPAQLADKLTTPDHIINSYEWYEESYSAIKNQCTQISILEKSTQKSSGGFSTSERILNLKNKLSSQVEEYNAKSRMITKSMWKSPKLPYQIDFNNVCK